MSHLSRRLHTMNAPAWTNTRIIGGAAVALALCGPMTVLALHVQHHLEERIQAADYIALGTVTEQRATLSRVGAIRLISTLVTLKVERCLKHPQDEAAPDELTIQLPGGRVGDLEMTVSEVPTFRDGERVLVFLKRVPAEACQLVGGPDGKLTVSTDPHSGVELVRDGFGQPLTAEECAALGL
jgi:hypothetical protein